MIFKDIDEVSAECARLRAEEKYDEYGQPKNIRHYFIMAEKPPCECIVIESRKLYELLNNASVTIDAGHCKWHDLRKNPTDIPADSGDYLCCVEFRAEYYSEKLANEYCVVEWHNGKWYTGETIYYGIDVVAWREIEPFEVTE